MARYPPIIGNWYRSSEGDLFEVIASDLTNGTIEIQHADGALEEFYLDIWDALTPSPATQPDGWLGPMDVPREDLEQFDESLTPRQFDFDDFRNELDGIT